MALQKSNLNINFSQGLDTKSDPKQVSPGRFLSLKNSVFTKAGLLQKRNGYSALTALPDASSTFVTTFNGNLTALGSSLQALSEGSSTWVNKGAIQPVKVNVLPLIRSSINQSQADTAIAANGLVCTVWTDNVPSAGITTPAYKYAIADSVTGQNIVAPTLIAAPTGATTGSPRVFILGKYFIIVFTVLVSTTYHLEYIAINSIVPTSVTVAANITSAYTPSTRVNFDGVVANNSLYLAWNGNDGTVKMTYIDSTLVQHNIVSFASKQCTVMSVTADTTGSTAIIYASFYNSSGTTGFTLAVNQQLNTVLAPTSILAAGVILNITSSAQNGVCTVQYEVQNTYTYDSGIATNIVNKKTVTQAGVVSGASTVLRSVGLASKSFIINDIIYCLYVYDSIYQPTYFLSDSSGHIISKLAYSNGNGYFTLGLPSVAISDDTASISYLVKDLIQSVNKTQGVANTAGIYSQTGINLASFTVTTSNIVTAEIGKDLHISGGFLWMYDGYRPVEHGFHLWPDYVEATTAGTGGLITAQQYFYVATYEWTDNQGNVFRSAPSIPFSVTTTGTTSANTIYVPTLRLTYKTANPATIVIYRWSTGQQNYYEVTSVQAPILNDTSVDYITFVDTQVDSAILGNTILYTTGGVVENIAAPATDTMTLYKSRLVLVDSEDKNLLWYSKQVIENTPVEMSDLFTIYVAPTTGAQGATGPISALSAMDDKLIVFKRDAIYYITGNGPDNTGANNDFSDPVFITATVGSTNQQSIVFMPNGLMFQSDKGIWLLGRDLSTQYIGAPVEEFTQDALVQSAVNVPGTNQVRFTMDSGITLMYDYFYGQWGTFVNVPAISSTLYENMHTYINVYGKVYQETIGTYLDGSQPVLMSFTTGWLNLAGLQGYERAYFFYILGTYLSPHKLSVQIAYDYNPSPTQQSVIIPDNYSPTWGGLQLWGSGAAWGGIGNIEPWRVFLERQKCEAFQITINELYDSSYGVVAGAGVTLSGLDIIFGVKSGYPRRSSSRSVG